MKIKNIDKKKLAIYSVIAVIAITLILYITVFSQDEAAFDEDKDLGIPTDLITVTKGELQKTINHTGTLVSEDKIAVSPQVMADVKEVYITEGDYVETGEKIVKLDDSKLMAKYRSVEIELASQRENYQHLQSEVENFQDQNPAIAKYEQAKSDYEYLQNELEKYETLYESDVIPESDFLELENEVSRVASNLEEAERQVDEGYRQLVHERDMARKQLERMQAELNELELEIAETEIRAPVSGQVDEIMFSPGELAPAGEPVALIEQNDDYIVRTSVNEANLQNISLQTEANIYLPAFSKEVKGEVIKIDTSANPATRSVEIEIGNLDLTEQIDGEIYSGVSSRVELIVDEITDEVIVEQNAIKELANQQVVYIEEEGAVREQKITTGLEAEGKVEILDGIEAGDNIAISNLNRLYHGADIFDFQGVDEQ